MKLSVFIVYVAMSVSVRIWSQSDNEIGTPTWNETVEWISSKSAYYNVEHNSKFCVVKQEFEIFDNFDFLLEVKNLSAFKGGGIGYEKYRGNLLNLAKIRAVTVVDNELDNRFKKLRISVDGAFRYRKGEGWNTNESFEVQVLDGDNIPYLMCNAFLKLAKLSTQMEERDRISQQ